MVLWQRKLLLRFGRMDLILKSSRLTLALIGENYIIERVIISKL